MNKLKKPAFWLAIIGAIKLITDAFGLQLISSEQVDQISNGLAAIFAVVGIYISHD